jgi:hypothetical protein
MAASPVFIGTPQLWACDLSVASTVLDGSSNVVQLVQGASGGTRIDKIRVVGVGTVTDGIVRIYTHDGTIFRLWRERKVTATIPSGTVPGFEDEFAVDVVLPTTSWKLYAATHKAELFKVYALGGNAT